MAQSVKSLLHQYKDLSWNQRVVVCSCNLSSGAMKSSIVRVAQPMSSLRDTAQKPTRTVTEILSI